MYYVYLLFCTYIQYNNIYNTACSLLTSIYIGWIETTDNHRDRYVHECLYEWNTCECECVCNTDIEKWQRLNERMRSTSIVSRFAINSHIITFTCMHSWILYGRSSKSPFRDSTVPCYSAQHTPHIRSGKQSAANWIWLCVRVSSLWVKTLLLLFEFLRAHSYFSSSSFFALFIVRPHIINDNATKINRWMWTDGGMAKPARHVGSERDTHTHSEGVSERE